MVRCGELFPLLISLCCCYPLPLYISIGFVADSMGDLYTLSTAPMFWHEKLL